MDFLNSKRLFISPAVKFDFGDDTELTLLANYQDDDLENQSTGFLPVYGTMLPNPLGKVPVGRNLGETGYNFFKREQWSAGYDFSHRFNDTLPSPAEPQVLRREGGFARRVRHRGSWTPTSTACRTTTARSPAPIFPFNERIDSLTVDTRG